MMIYIFLWVLAGYITLGMIKYSEMRINEKYPYTINRLIGEDDMPALNMTVIISVVAMGLGGLLIHLVNCFIYSYPIGVSLTPFKDEKALKQW